MSAHRSVYRRADLLRYLLDGRSEGVSREAVARAAGALLDVPETEMARLEPPSGRSPATKPAASSSTATSASRNP